MVICTNMHFLNNVPKFKHIVSCEISRSWRSVPIVKYPFAARPVYWQLSGKPLGEVVAYGTGHETGMENNPAEL